MKREKLAITSGLLYILIMGIGMLTLGSSRYSYNDPNMVKVLIYFEIIMSALAFMVYKKLKLNSLHASFKFSYWLVPLILILLLMILSLVISGDLSSSPTLIIMVGLTTLLVGFSEELMFRGIILKVMLEKRSVIFALLISSGFFSLLHSVNIFGGLSIKDMLVQLVLTFILGLIFSCLVLLIKNLIPLIIYHFIWDFVLVSQPITRANVHWISGLGIIIELIILIPLFIYTIKNFNRQHPA